MSGNSYSFDHDPAAMPYMIELPMMTSDFNEPVPVPYAPNDAVELEDFTIDRLLQDHFSEIPFRQRFRNDPLLQQVTLGQVQSIPFALNSFLEECQKTPGCGKTSLSRLRWVLEMASAGLVNGASDHEDAAVQGGVSCKDGRN